MGDVVGVASSSMTTGQSIGYVIPVSILHLFLNEVEATGKWSGVSELGISFFPLESDTFREYLGMKAHVTGVMVLKVAPLGPLHDKIRPRDFLTHIDDLPISNEGKVPVTLSGQAVHVPMNALVTCKPKGEKTNFTFLRYHPLTDTKIVKHETIEVEMTPIPPLVPRYHGVDCHPEYIVLGGFVFCKACVPLLQKMDEGYHVRRKAEQFKQTPNQEMVLLLKILEHGINIGYEYLLKIVVMVDNIEITSLKQLAFLAIKMIQEGDSNDNNDVSDFVEIHLAHPPIEPNSILFAAHGSVGGGIHQQQQAKRPKISNDTMELLKIPDIVLKRSDLPLATREVCEAYGIDKPISPSLLVQPNA